MCYNCGCGIPNDDMGQGHAELEHDGKSITDETFTKLGEKWGMDKHAAQMLVFNFINGDAHDEEKQQYMEHLYEHAAESQGMSKKEAENETLKLLKKQLGEK
jgi:hypothetical protein